MPRTIKADGKTYVVPDDATDDEINAIVGPGGGAPPVQQAAPSAPAPGSIAAVKPMNLSQPPAAPKQGFFSSAADTSGLSMLAGALRHPIDTAKNIGGMVMDSSQAVTGHPEVLQTSQNPITSAIRDAVGNTIDNVKLGVADYKSEGLTQKTRRDFGRAVPVAGPILAKAQGQQDSGNTPGMLGTLAGAVGGTAAPEAISSIKRLPQFAKAAVVGDVTKPITPGGPTPLARFNSAKALGVNLDAADATNSGVLKGVKRLNEHSLLGSGTYDKARAANLDNLAGSTDTFLNGLYGGDRESGGAAIQTGLKANQTGLKTAADEGFKQLTTDTKGQIIPAESVGQDARTLLGNIQPFADLYPSLAPTKTISVLNDLKSVGMPSRVNVGAPAPPVSGTFADLQRLRSATHDLTTTNPDLVKSQSIAPLQMMTGSLDDAMTGASKGLTPQQESLFRRANANWKDMKATYDDPSSPLYHAVRTQTPSTLYGGSGLGPKTPEMARDVLSRLAGSNAEGALRRGVVESALKTTNDGSPNFKTFGTQLNRIPADYRSELFTPAQQRTLGDVQNTANVLHTDVNPSGTAKMTLKLGEGSALGSTLFGHPTGALPLLQYPVAKLMNSPSVVDRLMRPNVAKAPVTGPRIPMRLLPFVAPQQKR